MPRHSAASTSPILRAAIPLLALTGFATMALLWVSGLHGAYFAVLRLFGFGPWKYPFVDAQAVLAAVECRRLGIDVYLSNPCDVLGRPHVYSPLWLTIVPRWFGTGQTMPVGVVVDLVFIAMLVLVFRPRGWRELPIYALAVASPMTVYAVERANNDLVVFLLVVLGTALTARSRLGRWLGNGAFLLAGLLKYYPLALLLLLAGERWREALRLAGVAAAAILLFLIWYRHELTLALADIPGFSYYMDAFSARNLPLGLARVARHSLPPSATAAVTAGVLLVIAADRVRRLAALLGASPVDWQDRATQTAMIGSLLLVGCFVAGSNGDYRGVWFLLVLPGLWQLRGSLGDRSIRRWLSGLIAVVLLLMWQDFFRHGLYAVSGLVSPASLRLRLGIVLWVGREIAWWWLMTGLAALLVAYFRSLPTLRDAEAWLRWACARFGAAAACRTWNLRWTESGPTRRKRASTPMPNTRVLGNRLDQREASKEAGAR